MNIHDLNRQMLRRALQRLTAGRPLPHAAERNAHMTVTADSTEVDVVTAAASSLTPPGGNLAETARQLAAALAVEKNITQASARPDGLVVMRLTEASWLQWLTAMGDNNRGAFPAGRGRETTAISPEQALDFQYVHTRCCSVLETAAQIAPDRLQTALVDKRGAALVTPSPHELIMIKTLALWSRPLQPSSGKNIHRLLAKTTEAFDELWTNAPENATLRFVTSDNTRRAALLLRLTATTGEKIAIGLRMIGLDAPQELR